MKETVYKCDLCNKKKEEKDLLGIHWTGKFGQEVPMLKQWPNNHNTHICLFCLESLKKGVDKS